MLVFGTRPEAIKMCPVVRELQKLATEFEPIIVTTGQHKEMLQQVLEIFQIEPTVRLDIMKKGQTLTDITQRVLEGVGHAINQYQPDMILVHGDTTTSVAAALAAFYNQVPIGHVEAGLRTWEKYSPFPEEMNRQLTARMADLHFAPTQKSKENLMQEGIKKHVYVTGNTAIDALAITQERAYYHPILEQVNEKRMILMTIHRRENLEKNMRAIFTAVHEVVSQYPDVEVVFPMHLNPTIRKEAQELLGNHSKVHLIEPLDVVGFHHFMKHAYLILTDSGGVQEEAPSLGTPVLVARDTTERPEGVEAGTLRLVGTQPDTLVKEMCRLLDDEECYQNMKNIQNPYGDGTSSQKIVSYIEEFFHIQQREVGVL